MDSYQLSNFYCLKKNLLTKFNKTQEFDTVKKHSLFRVILSKTEYLNGTHAFVLNRKHWKILILAQRLIDSLVIYHIIWTNQKQTETLFCSTSCASTSMDICLRSSWDLFSEGCKWLSSSQNVPFTKEQTSIVGDGYLIVDDMLDIWNVKPPSSNISREKDTAMLIYKGS